MGPNRRVLPHSLLVLATACGNSHPAAPDAAAPADAPADAGSYAIVELATMPYTSNARTWTIHLDRIDRPDGGHTYVEYIPSDTAGARPAMVMTEPYVGIDWSGDPLDVRWAASTAQANGMFLDVDGPGYTGIETISYNHETAAQMANDNNLELLDGFAVVMVFGRYYAGGTIREYVADMAAGMWFVAEQAAIDKTRVGIYGASLGGFEALWAAVNADPRALPATVVAAFPVSDWTTEADHMASRAEPAKDFLTTYLHRLYVDTGGPPEQAGTDYTGLRVTDVCAHLPAATLALHDQGDNLVPIAETYALVADCGVTPIYWDRATPPDPGLPSHGLLTFEPGVPSYATFALTYLAIHLLAPDMPGLLMAYTPASMTQQLQTAHAAQVAGHDISFEAPRLVELADPRVGLLSTDDCTTTSCPIHTGASVIAGLVNSVWSTSFTDQTIAAGLAGGMPAP